MYEEIRSLSEGENKVRRKIFLAGVITIGER
jgi:hypothetical protein